METYSIEVDRPNWWDEPLLLSSYSPIVPSPTVLESLTPFDGMKKEIKDVIELIEDPQETQQNSITREAIPLSYPQKSLDPHMAHHKVDNFNEYITETNDLPNTPLFEPTSLWINQYETISSPPIVSLLKTPPNFEVCHFLSCLQTPYR